VGEASLTLNQILSQHFSSVFKVSYGDRGWGRMVATKGLFIPSSDPIDRAYESALSPMWNDKRGRRRL